MKRLSIVIPCFNSAENIPDLQVALEDIAIKLTGYELEIILVDDGSKDETYNALLQFSQSTPLLIKLIKLTGNFGSYNAFLAGLNHGTGDVYAQLHPDLQDPPQHLVDMLQFWEKGFRFVIGIRTDREDKNSNEVFAKFYHWLMKKIALPHIPSGGYDLIVFDKELRDHVVSMNESNTNLVYLISWLRYPFVTVPLTRMSRKKGRSQWTFNKKLKLLMDSVVSFSYTPIRWITFTSLLILVLSFAFLIFLVLTSSVSFETKIIAGLILLFGNLILVVAGVIGEYVWRNLEASRKRPPFIVESISENSSL